MNRILIVEDNVEIQEMETELLTKSGYETVSAYSGTEAMLLVEREEFDLIILDIMLPGMQGDEVLKKLKGKTDAGILCVSALDALDTRVGMMREGADDYIVKPFEIVELLARINIVLRRYDKSEKILTLGDLVVNTESNEVTKAGEEIRLTPKEFEMLVLFLRNKNITLYRDRIYEEVWGGDSDAETRTVDLHVQRIRKKVGLKNSLVTVYNMGYKITER